MRMNGKPLDQSLHLKMCDYLSWSGAELPVLQVDVLREDIEKRSLEKAYRLGKIGDVSFFHKDFVKMKCKEI